MNENAVELGVEVGQVVGGRYRLDRVIGHGGMGVVVAATDLATGRAVALKRLLPEVAKESESVARFLREVSAARHLRSEHLAALLDLGQLEDGAPYMVLELLEGRDLGDRLASEGHLSVEESVSIALQTLAALDVAHTAGFIHRDLKPENLFLCDRSGGPPHVKVLDFGITKSTKEGAPARRVTRTSGGLLGSPHYMSPEQIRSPKLVDPRSDLWSLGVILYECLSGAPPFDADSVGALLAAIMVEPHVPLRMRKPDLPSALIAVVERCLAKTPAERYSSAAELAGALGALGVVAWAGMGGRTPESSPTADGRAAGTVPIHGVAHGVDPGQGAGPRDAPERSGAPAPSWPAGHDAPTAVFVPPAIVVEPDSKRRGDPEAQTAPFWMLDPQHPQHPRPAAARSRTLVIGLVVAGTALAAAAGAALLTHARRETTTAVPDDSVAAAPSADDSPLEPALAHAPADPVPALPEESDPSAAAKPDSTEAAAVASAPPSPGPSPSAAPSANGSAAPLPAAPTAVAPRARPPRKVRSLLRGRK